MLREAQSMARLGDHPNVVTVHDIGEEDGDPYIVSQYMAGGAARRPARPAAEPPARPRDHAKIAAGITQALEHAHGNGVVHRDLKPANVFLTEDGTAKLGDFGLAFSMERSACRRRG